MDSPRRYASLLLITASKDTAAQFARLLPADRFAPEYNVCSPLEAGIVLGDALYDVVVIDGSVSPDTARDLAAAAEDAGIGNVLLLADSARFPAAAEFAERHGFLALPSPVDPALLKQSLGMMATASARIHELEEKAENLQAKMDEMRVVNRAKLILVQRFGMSEKDAHHFIEKNAMDRCVRRRVIAENIIRTYQN